MQDFHGFFTKAFIAFTNFTAREGQIINLIKNNEVAVIILMIFTTTLSKIWVNIFWNTIPIFTDFFLEEVADLNFFTLTDKVNPVNTFYNMHFLHRIVLNKLNEIPIKLIKTEDFFNNEFTFLLFKELSILLIPRFWFLYVVPLIDPMSTLNSS